MLNYNNLKNIEKPARYLGGEANQVLKDLKKISCRFAVAVPNVYETGMIDFDMKSVYYILNNIKDVWCERVFAPMQDFENLLRLNNKKLYTLESKTPLKSMDIVAFFLNTELIYTNMLNILNLGGIPTLKDRRKDSFPFIIAQINGVANPKPLETFVDIFVIGELPEIVEEIIDKYREWKQTQNNRKEEFYKQIKDIQGVYIPDLHSSDETKINMVKNTGSELERFPENIVVPSISNNIDGNIIRLTKGCTRGCRGCIQKYAYGKIIEKDISEVVKHSKTSMQNTGCTNVILMSNCQGDYTGFPEVIYALEDIEKPEIKNISFMEVKLNKENLWLLKYMNNKDNYPSIVVGGTNKKLRKIFGIDISDDEILEVVKKVFENDFTKIRLKYIIGIPKENYEDLAGILKLAENIIKIYFEVYSKMPDKYIVEIELYNFYAKSGTPMQWCQVNSPEKLELKARYLMDKNKNENIYLTTRDTNISSLITMLSRGNADMGKVIYEAWKQGARFDNIEQLFNYDAWSVALNKVGIDIKKCLEEIKIDSKLEWDSIELGTTKEELAKEYIEYIRGKNEDSSNQ